MIKSWVEVLIKLISPGHVIEMSLFVYIEEYSDREGFWYYRHRLLADL